jgi:hypothetical protein
MYEERKINSVLFGDNDLARVGHNYYSRMVKEIEQHAAQGEGDKWFYDIIFDNDEKLRVFNPVEVEFGKPTENSF